MRLKICEQWLEAENNGFTFDSSRPLKCKHKTHIIQFYTITKSTKANFWIYTCPPVLYTDLETSAQMTLPYIYKISVARTYDAAILFVQKYSESKDLHPQKYVRNIKFNELRRYSDRSTSESKMSITTQDEIIRNYLQEKNIISRKYLHIIILSCALSRNILRQALKGMLHWLFQLNNVARSIYQ